MRVKTFMLGAHKISVKYQKTVYDSADGSEIMGKANFSTNTIEVATHSYRVPAAEDVVTHTFYHEMVHCVLNIMGEHELNSNEQFVDTLALFIQQFNQTKK